MGAWHQLSNSHPLPPPPPSPPSPPLFILSYADLFMNTLGSGDHVPFTTSGLDFQRSTYPVSLQNVSLGCQFEWKKSSFLCVFLAQSYNCIRANDAGISWCFLKANTPSPPSLFLSPALPPPIPHSLQLLTSRHACVNAPCFDRELFFHWDHNGIIRLREIPCLRGFLDFFFDRCPIIFSFFKYYSLYQEKHI